MDLKDMGEREVENGANRSPKVLTVARQRLVSFS